MATGQGFEGWAKKAWKEGRFAECADFYRRAAEVFDAAGEFMRGAHAARHRAEALIKAGDAKRASECILEVVRFYRGQEVGRLEMANALRVAGLAEEDCGRRDEARAFWAEAREGYLAEGIDAGVAEADRRMKILAGG
jgi:tetratricopeptide (TPR) repeat protein